MLSKEEIQSIVENRGEINQWLENKASILNGQKTFGYVVIYRKDPVYRVAYYNMYVANEDESYLGVCELELVSGDDCTSENDFGSFKEALEYSEATYSCNRDSWALWDEIEQKYQESFFE